MPFERFRRAPGDPPLVYGHRGVRGEAPENTMSAFTIAADAGAYGVELDVRLCRSGELVVCHDPTLERVSEAGDDRSVAVLSYVELRQVRLAGGEIIPLLGDVLAWARQRAIAVNVEMKHDVPDRGAVVRASVREIRREAAADRVLVSSFDPVMLARLRMRAPTLGTAFLFGDEQRWRTGWPARIIRCVAVHPQRTLVDAASVRKMRPRIVNVWTVNEPDEARRLSALGVDGIITDVPARILAATR